MCVCGVRVSARACVCLCANASDKCLLHVLGKLDVPIVEEGSVRYVLNQCFALDPDASLTAGHWHHTKQREHMLLFAGRARKQSYLA